MTLPVLKYPVINVKILSSDSIVKARPFLVSEEKLLLMAAETKDPNSMSETVFRVIETCLEDKTLNIRTLPFFDVYNLFTTLRAKSIGEKSVVNYTCKNVLENNETCNTKFKVELDVGNMELEVNKKISNTVQISDNVVIKLKYPNYSDLKREISGETTLDRKIRILYGCIDTLTDCDKVLTRKDFTPDDWKTWCDNLTTAQMNQLEAWVENLPVLFVRTKAECPKCKFIHDIQHKDMEDFFL